MFSHDTTSVHDVKALTVFRSSLNIQNLSQHLKQCRSVLIRDRNSAQFTSRSNVVWIQLHSSLLDLSHSDNLREAFSLMFEVGLMKIFAFVKLGIIFSKLKIKIE